MNPVVLFRKSTLGFYL